MKKPSERYPVPKAGIQKLFLTSSLSFLCLIFFAFQASGNPDSGSPAGKNVRKNPASTEIPQQQIRITGTVTDENSGDPVPGVNIVVEGTTTGTISDLSGRYAINVPDANSVLVFTFVGYNTERRAVGTNQVLNVSLKESTSALDEVVIIGYGTQKKVTVTGAVSSITTESLIASPVANISNALVGKMPGLLSQQNSGEPGEDASTLRIRGIGTFTGSASPLIMVDGIETQSFNNIDPNEIENLSILKDASATAVYGVRGANGVILITTKRGQVGKPQVSFSTNFAMSSFVNEFRDMANAYEFASGREAAIRYDSYVSGSYVPYFTAQDLEYYQNHESPIFHSDTDWFGLLFKDQSFQNQQNFNIRGGTEEVKYFVSLGRFNQQGLFNNTNLQPDFFDMQTTYTRYNFRSNFDFKVTKRISANVNISTITDNKKGQNQDDASSTIRAFTLANPIIGPGLLDDKFIVVQNPKAGGAAAYNNPLLGWYRDGYRKEYENYLTGSMRVNYDLGFITRGLSSHITFSYQNYNRLRQTYSKTIIAYSAFPDLNGDPIIAKENQEGAFSSSESTGKRRRNDVEAGLNYERTFGVHSFTGLLLYNQTRIFDPGLEYLIPKGYQGLVGRVAYDFKRRYLAEFNWGYNGTENFATGYRFGFFPAYSLGWAVTEEPWFPKNNIVNYIKVRGSYGEIGNDLIGGERFLYRASSYNYGGTGLGAAYHFGVTGLNQGDYQGSYEGKQGNPQVTWERAKKTNIGIDITTIKSMLRFQVDLFKERRDNILTTRGTVPDLFGNTSNLPAANIGIMENKGIDGEFSFNANAGQVHYWIQGNYTLAVNKIIYRDEVYNPYAYQYTTGQRAGQYFGYADYGLYNEWSEVRDAVRPKDELQNNFVQPGEPNIKDVNGDGVINTFDRVPIQYSDFPEQIFGFSFGGEYKGFDVSILFQGAGRVTFDANHNYYRRWANNDAIPSYVVNNSWTYEKYLNGDLITFPALLIQGGPRVRSHAMSNAYHTSASYLRFKNMEIGYTINLKRWNINAARIYISGNNIFTFVNKEMRTQYPGVEPESKGARVNNEPYPITRTFNLGLNLNF
jgi:TonB-linked SusC/RagA family outer membrane protein